MYRLKYCHVISRYLWSVSLDHGGHLHRKQGDKRKLGENIFDEKVEEKSGKFIKNCRSQGKSHGKMKLF